MYRNTITASSGYSSNSIRQNFTITCRTFSVFSQIGPKESLVYMRPYMNLPIYEYVSHPLAHILSKSDMAGFLQKLAGKFYTQPYLPKQALLLHKFLN
jgi:uncharacterized membrane protein YhfC